MAKDSMKEKVEKKDSKEVQPSVQEVKIKKPYKERRWWIKDLILAAVNITFTAALFILLGKMPTRANELSQLRNTYIVATAKSEVQIAEFEIEESRQKADELKRYFPNQAGLANFAGEMDKLREEGLISSFSFASEDAVRDQTGYYGVPIIIRFLNTWEQIEQGFTKLGELPYIIRAVNIEAGVADGNLIDFRYGGFLYVDESLAKTR
jgi:Tfp pilus assembly protein PilO